MTSKTIFETDRLLVRTWSLDDAPDAFLIYSNKEVTQYMPNAAIEDIDRMRERIIKIHDRDRKWAEGIGSFASTLKTTGELIGNLLIRPLPDHDSNDTEDIEIGWHLARHHWGRGLATEGGRGLLQHGFENLSLEKLFAVVHPENERSCNVARRINMRHQGQTDLYYGKIVELYSMTLDQWRSEKTTRYD